MKQICTLSILIFFFFFNSNAQYPIPATSAEKRLENPQIRQKLADNSLVNEIKFRSIGPSVMSGRVADISVNPNDPTEFYVAYASGGLWHTTNNGTSFKPIFDNETVMTIGDIAVNWKSKTIWVGTGENNSSRSSYSGVGIYKSSDNGKNWEYLGLPESHHIGRIILHPSDENIAWVAALGHLYSPNKERGIYKTTDGGKTWTQKLFVSENAGAIDLIQDPNNVNILYTSIWHRERRAWNFVEAGEKSGIYKSEDSGETWNKISTEKSGFPQGKGLGRIGLAIFDSNTIYAFLDNQARRPAEKDKKNEQLTKNDLREMSKEDFLKIENKKLDFFLLQNRFPKKYKAKKIKQMVKSDEITPNNLVIYLEDANTLLFDTPVIGGEVYRSDDAGKTWQKTHKNYLDGLCYSYGYYFGLIRVAPQDKNTIYIAGVPILKSDDDGKTFKNINGENVHADHHALWLNPNKKGHLINGNDGGINITYDDGETWIKCNSPAVGQFYYINVDMEKPYNVYGGLQDNGVWFGSSTHQESNSWHQSGKYAYEFIMGGDGMQVQIDSRDNETIYTGYQFGNYYRFNRNGGRRHYIQPKHELGEKPLRFNWQTPIHLSIHNEDILYLGSNKLHRSMKKGKNFEAISNDLTKGGKKGDVAYGTLTSIHESSLKFGLIYTGSDDGLIHVSKDGGETWKRISNNLPQDLWVSRIQASSHFKSRVYACLNGYRWDDFSAYLFVSDDYGETWQNIALELPNEAINVIKEDPENENLIYVGTDHGVYISLNKGKNFMLMNKDLPAAPVHDLVIHPRDKDLVVGTHGRSIYIANIEHLQQLDAEILAKELHAFEIEKIRFSSFWGEPEGRFRDFYEPEILIPIYTNQNSGIAKVKIYAEDLLLQELELEIKKGLNYLPYDLSINPKKEKAFEKYLNENSNDKIKLEASKNKKIYLQKGEYKIEIILNDKQEDKYLKIN